MSLESLLRTETVLEGCETDHKRYRCSSAEEASRKFLILYRKLRFKFLVFFLMLSSRTFASRIRDFTPFNSSVELKIFYGLPVYRLTKELSFYTSSITFATVIKPEVNLKDTCEVLNEEYDRN